MTKKDLIESIKQNGGNVGNIDENGSGEKKTTAIEITMDNWQDYFEIVEKEEVDVTDDYELVAVIAAAIAASEGAASTDGFVVRSVRKVNRRR